MAVLSRPVTDTEWQRIVEHRARKREFLDLAAREQIAMERAILDLRNARGNLAELARRLDVGRSTLERMVGRAEARESARI